MNTQNTHWRRFSDTKPHFNILDGLRGAAALMVVWYHVFEGFAFASTTAITTFNHGYLAVDFFFLLSGFVISYAYDSRWSKSTEGSTPQGSNSQWHTPQESNPQCKSFTIWSFFKRRLVRLHPMVVMGAVIGAISFLFGGCLKWDGTQTQPLWILAALIMGIFLIPAYPGAGYDVRGNGEMYSLNGPSWSLFFEYIGNIMYALFVRKLSGKGLGILSAVLGILLGWYAITDVSTYGMIGVGWTLDWVNFFGGFIRMMFPFTLGMFIRRKFKPCKAPQGIFWIAAAALFAIFSVPYIPAWGGICLNGVYELACIAIFFPTILWLGASATTKSSTQADSSNKKNGRESNLSGKIITLMGELSYPLYIVHYPVMYLFYQWLIKEKIYSIGECWPVVACIMALCIALAYGCLKLYDQPIRKWLGKKL